jgi:hypothetical protein
MAKVLKPTLKLNQRLVLNQYMLQCLGFEKFEDIARLLQRTELEGINAEGQTHFYEYLALESNRKKGVVSQDDLKQYDANIVNHTKAMQGKRPQPITWKYFQYIALLLTEIYLERYFQDASVFVEGLNAFLFAFNAPLAEGDKVALFEVDDLRKIAFWSATGSGKTLMMHIHLKQFLHYVHQYGKRRSFNRILLITPNEGLSKQHLAELQESGIDATIFTKSYSLDVYKDYVQIIEISKFKESSGETTVAVEAFESNNLLFVDEGHRGSSGKEWTKYRKALAKDGFTFEYSATFGQAVSKEATLAQEYAKSILFDYSYKYFHGDGFGKDYRILNLAKDEDEEHRQLYLTACLLTFYQQKYLFHKEGSQAGRFNLEDPLCVFVGGTVNAVRKENKKDVSDVVDVLLFLESLTSEANRKKVLERIGRLISGDTGLLNHKNVDIFANRFTALYKLTPEAILQGLLRNVFNAPTSGAFYVEDLKGVAGEIALRIGTNEAFGVISVGDVPQLLTLCEKHPSLQRATKHFSGSLFGGINKPNSSIHVLIGSKKFTEGWSSWRVSTMGLLNVGKSEGSEIIQLFGRGVRLKGFEHSLKRHSQLKDLGVGHHEDLLDLERLNIFGVRADYMAKFKEYLEEEGIKDADDTEEIIVPVRFTLGNTPLKTLGLKEGTDFKRQGDKPRLTFLEELTRNKVVLDERIRLQNKEGQSLASTEYESLLIERHFSKAHLAFLDVEALYFDLQQQKNEKSWFNLVLRREEILPILSNTDWYALYIHEKEMAFDDYTKVRKWQSIASKLLRKYSERFYSYKKNEYESKHREYKTLNQNDNNFFESYTVRVPSSEASVIQQLKELAQSLYEGTCSFEEKSFGQAKAVFFDQHLFQPLLCCESDQIKIKPVALNKGESQFVVDLKSYYEENPSFFENSELYLLRNKSKGGLSFFENNNFSPDFIMWLIKEGKQYITFVDPKGLRLLNPQDAKLTLHETLKKEEINLKTPNVFLDAFIVSVTKYNAIQRIHGLSKADLIRKHILFQEDINYINVLFEKLITSQSLLTSP